MKNNSKKNLKPKSNNWFNRQDVYFKFFLCVISVLCVLILFRLVYVASGVEKEVSVDSEIKTEVIISKNDTYNINVSYPLFKNIYVKKIINEYIYDYVNGFKEKNKRENRQNSTLNIKYDITFVNNYMIVYFDIKNSLDSSRMNKSIIINTKESEKVNNDVFIQNDILFNKVVKDKICKKYSKTICNTIKNVNINDVDIHLKNNNYIVTFNNTNTGMLVSYIPNVSVLISTFNEINEEKINVFNEINEEETLPSKYIAFTFDDGPHSQYTNQVIDALLENNSTATFFELGMRMKNNKAVVQRVSTSGMEIGNHSYSHANLASCTKKRYLFEINTTNIIYNSITQKYLSVLRPPFGSMNKMVRKNSPYPIVTWSVDTMDWHTLNSNKIYKHILKHAGDGEIVLMHDIYPSTVEAVRMVIPELNARGYKVVSVSQLASIKGITLNKGKVYRQIK